MEVRDARCDRNSSDSLFVIRHSSFVIRHAFSSLVTRHSLICSILAAAGWWAAAAWAQNFPVKPVRYVIPFPAGTSNDIVGRLLTDRLTRLWGQQVIVDNR